MNTYQKVLAKVFNNIETQLEKGIVPWQRPWTGGGFPKNAASGRQYSGVNMLILMLSGATSNKFLTYKQAKSLGGNVKKGAKGYPVIFFNVRYKDKNGKWLKKAKVKTMSKKQLANYESVPMARYFHVFDISDTEGIDFEDEGETFDFQPIEKAEAMLDAMKHVIPEIQHGENRAFYHPAKDFVNMPAKERFKTAEGYYSTLFHELVHSTGHESRLNREFSTTFGSSDYAFEELIAELGAMILRQKAGIAENPKTIENTASYCAGWLEAIRKDRNELYKASKQAIKAAQYLTETK